MDGAYERIIVDRCGEVLVLSLNNPGKLNAMDSVMRSELLNVFADADADEDSSVIVLTGAGRAFSAGGDVSEMAAGNLGKRQQEEVRIHHDGRRLLDQMLWVEKPMIAMVNGPAVGLGATMALFCDIVIADEAAKIGDTHVNVGLVAGDGGAAIWPLLIGIARAKEMLLTGRLLTGAEAAAIGLVNRAVSPSELRSVTFELAERIAAMPPFAARATKAAINRHLRAAVEDTIDFSMALETLSMLREEHLDASAAFMKRSKRPT